MEAIRKPGEIPGFLIFEVIILRHLLCIIILFIIFIAGCTNFRDPPVLKVDPGIISAVQSFLNYTSQNNWEKALSLLSGEALINAQENIKITNNKYEIVNSTINVLAYNDDYAHVQADVTFEDGTFIDRQFYQFILVKTSNRWKIIEQKNITPDFIGRIECSNIPTRIDQVVRSYITYAVNGNWTNASKYLTGQALQAAKLNYQGNVKTNMLPTKLRVTPIGVQNNVWKIKASYEIDNSSYVVILTVIDSKQPKISSLTLAMREGN